jgi:hypothetical protein
LAAFAIFSVQKRQATRKLLPQKRSSLKGFHEANVMQRDGIIKQLQQKTCLLIIINMINELYWLDNSNKYVGFY